MRSGERKRKIGRNAQKRRALDGGHWGEINVKAKAMHIWWAFLWLSATIGKEIFRIIQGLRDHGISILLIEQNVRQTLEIADRAYVLENGRIVSEGKSRELLQDDHIKKAYLGL